MVLYGLDLNGSGNAVIMYAYLATGQDLIAEACGQEDTGGRREVGICGLRAAGDKDGCPNRQVCGLFNMKDQA